MCLIKLVAPLSCPTSTSCRHRRKREISPHFLPRIVPSYSLPSLASLSFSLVTIRFQLKSVNDSGLRFQVRLEFLSIGLPINGRADARFFSSSSSFWIHRGSKKAPPRRCLIKKFQKSIIERKIASKLEIKNSPILI